jgi:hypothetical protein
MGFMDEIEAETQPFAETIEYQFSKCYTDNNRLTITASWYVGKTENHHEDQ